MEIGSKKYFMENTKQLQWPFCISWVGGISSGDEWKIWGLEKQYRNTLSLIYVEDHDKGSFNFVAM